MADIHLTDDQFFQILRENSGIFAQTARAIQQTYAIDYSRQAVRERALKQPEILADIEDEGLDIAEEGMNSLAKSDDRDIKFKACSFILKTKGRKRGYVERSELDVSGSMSLTWHEEKTYISPEGPMETKGVLHTKGGDVPR